jgi:hypothetical protein
MQNNVTLNIESTPARDTPDEFIAADDFEYELRQHIRCGQSVGCAMNRTRSDGGWLTTPGAYVYFDVKDDGDGDAWDVMATLFVVPDRVDDSEIVVSGPDVDAFCSLLFGISNEYGIDAGGSVADVRLSGVVLCEDSSGAGRRVRHTDMSIFELDAVSDLRYFVKRTLKDLADDKSFGGVSNGEVSFIIAEGIEQRREDDLSGLDIEDSGSYEMAYDATCSVVHRLFSGETGATAFAYWDAERGVLGSAYDGLIGGKDKRGVMVRFERPSSFMNSRPDVLVYVYVTGRRLPSGRMSVSARQLESACNLIIEVSEEVSEMSEELGAKRVLLQMSGLTYDSEEYGYDEEVIGESLTVWAARDGGFVRPERELLSEIKQSVHEMAVNMFGLSGVDFD